MKIRKVRKEITNDIQDMIEGSLDKAIEKLTELKYKHQDDFEELVLEFDVDDYGSGAAIDVCLTGIRDENLVEKNRRLKQDKHRDEVREKAERQKYERLKKKYEK